MNKKLKVHMFVCRSDVTNGGAVYNYKHHLLQQQAEAERLSPSLPGLLEFMKDKEVVVTQTAKTRFLNILSLVGGTFKRNDTFCIVFLILH
jgi:uncharacterized protein Smg (DUF494 family)